MERWSGKTGLQWLKHSLGRSNSWSWWIPIRCAWKRGVAEWAEFSTSAREQTRRQWHSYSLTVGIAVIGHQVFPINQQCYARLAYDLQPFSLKSSQGEIFLVSYQCLHHNRVIKNIKQIMQSLWWLWLDSWSDIIPKLLTEQVDFSSPGSDLRHIQLWTLFIESSSHPALSVKDMIHPPCSGSALGIFPSVHLEGILTGWERAAAPIWWCLKAPDPVFKLLTSHLLLQVAPS